MSESFIPRKVARPGATAPPPRRTIPIFSSQPIPELPQSDTKGKGKGSDQTLGVSKEDYAVLVHLALSEYALWLDSDLLRRSTEHKTEGFIPISYLLQHSCFLSNLTPIPPEWALVKAIRTHLDEVFETRILVSSPVKWDWHAQSSSFSGNRGSSGGYEIRRRDWQTVAEMVAQHSKVGWDKRTVYVEKLSPRFRTIPSVCRFVASLLGESSSFLQIQNVTIPAHHLDTGELQPKPKLKGFAFVTLLSLQGAEHILRDWPWTRQNTSSDGLSIVAQEAAKFGFRTLSKARWEELKDEYLTYRTRLLDDIATSEDNVPAPRRPSQPEAESTSYPRTGASASYPVGCLVYVKNICPETNKTTLRTLFTSAVGGGKEWLDYVDFNKGMDTCFLRVATPAYAQMLVDHFAAQGIVQLDGLDDAGTQIDSANKVIAVELIEGKKEEIYWEKVPEKVRRQAVEKVMQDTDNEVEREKRQRMS